MSHSVQEMRSGRMNETTCGLAGATRRYISFFTTNTFVGANGQLILNFVSYSFSGVDPTILVPSHPFDVRATRLIILISTD